MNKIIITQDQQDGEQFHIYAKMKSRRTEIEYTTHLMTIHRDTLMAFSGMSPQEIRDLEYPAEIEINIMVAVQEA